MKHFSDINIITNFTQGIEIFYLMECVLVLNMNHHKCKGKMGEQNSNLHKKTWKYISGLYRKRCRHDGENPYIGQSGPRPMADNPLIRSQEKWSTEIESFLQTILHKRAKRFRHFQMKLLIFSTIQSNTGLIIYYFSVFFILPTRFHQNFHI